MKIKSYGPDGDPHSINDGTNYDSVLLSDAYGLRKIDPIMAERQGSWPRLGGIKRPVKEIYVNTIILAGSAAELMSWFDPVITGEESVLIVENDGGGNDRYIEAICTEAVMVNKSGLEWIFTLTISEDVYLREVTPTTPSDWNITASGQTNNYTNNGDMPAYPIITITPTTQKSGGSGYTYRRFIQVLWTRDEGAVNYPTDIVNNNLDTAALVTGGKLQADGDDLRVFVDGIEVDRWLDDINTTNTSIWVNLDWEPYNPCNLDGAIGASDTEIKIKNGGTGDFDRLPNSGIMVCGGEFITYTAKNSSTRTIEGCTRGAKGGTAASHADGTSIIHVNHDIWIVYGDSTVSAPDTDDDFKPMFEIASSSNTSWDFDSFLTNDGYRSASWLYALTSVVYKYGGNQGTQADPWVELGLEHEGRRPTSGHWGRAYIYVPASLSAANFQNGQKKCDDKNDWALGEAFISSSIDGSNWSNEYSIPAPSSNDTWEAWSQNIASLPAGTKYIGIYVNDQRDDIWVEASDITLTLSNPFSIGFGNELTDYHLTCTITNNTTGDAISLLFPMSLNEDLEINTDEKTVISLEDNSNQFGALTLEGGTRKEWLKLDPGINQLQFDETGLVAVTVSLEWEERLYE